MEQALNVWAEAFVRLIQRVFDRPPHVDWRKPLWVDFRPVVVLGPAVRARGRQHALIAPMWDFGFLAAIAAIRTFLNYFSEKDIEEARTAPGRERIEA